MQSSSHLFGLGIGVAEFFIFLLILLLVAVTIGPPTWAVVDAGSKDDWMWRDKGHSKKRWLTLLTVSAFLQPFGVVVFILYFAWIRPRLRAAQRERAQLSASSPPPASPSL